jgi:hypothetical protein
MSLKIAVALATTLGAAILTSTMSEARPVGLGYVAGLRGDDSPDQRRFYLAFNQGPAIGKPAKRRVAKHRHPTLLPAEAKHDNPSTDLRFGAFPFDPMTAH